MKAPIKVAVTGAAGQVAYSLLYRLAAGEVFGPDQPIVLHLLEIPPAMGALKGVAMELDDCAFPLLQGMVLADDPNQGFDGVNWALLVGSKPRSKGMERADLLKENGKIFVGQGKALQRGASDIRVAVVGNPANTNALIAMNNAPDIPQNRFSALTRLDHNRAVAQLALKAGVGMADVSNVTIWGNHSATQYPDFIHAKIKGKAVTDVISDRAWLEGEFISTVQKRGAAIIEARGVSSAASAANGTLDHVKSFITPTPAGDWFSAAIVSDGSYGVPKGLISSFPLRTSNGTDWEIVQGLDIDAFSQSKIDATVAELDEERTMVSDFLGK